MQELWLERIGSFALLQTLSFTLSSTKLRQTCANFVKLPYSSCALGPRVPCLSIPALSKQISVEQPPFVSRVAPPTGGTYRWFPVVAPSSDIQLGLAKKATAACNLRDLRWVLHFSGSLDGASLRWLNGLVVFQIRGSLDTWLLLLHRTAPVHNLPIHVSTASAAAFEIKLTAVWTLGRRNPTDFFIFCPVIFTSAVLCAKLKSILSASLTEAPAPRPKLRPLVDWCQVKSSESKSPGTPKAAPYRTAIEDAVIVIIVIFAGLNSQAIFFKVEGTTPGIERDPEVAIVLCRISVIKPILFLKLNLS